VHLLKGKLLGVAAGSFYAYVDVARGCFIGDNRAGNAYFGLPRTWVPLPSGSIYHLAKVPYQDSEHCGRIVESHVAIDAEVYGGEVPACQVVSGGQFSRAIYRGRGRGHIITHVIRQGSQGSMLGFDFTSTLLGSR
jgi:hypothetical protein